jgi:chromosome segregation ATPase
MIRPETSAPLVRTVDALTGQVAPTKYFQALSEADDYCKELDGLRELQTRLAEVESENTDLSERLLDLQEAHATTLGLLAQARREIARIKSERDTLRAQVSAGVR